MSDEKAEYHPEWEPDCQGKWDYDCNLVFLSCRYWPQGGCFHAPGQQRDVDGTVALGQPVGHGSDSTAGDPSAQGDKLLTVAERNIRSFLRSATFKSESDREAALNCVDVLSAALASAVPAAQEDALDTVRLNWLEDVEGRFYNIDRISAVVGTGFLTRTENGTAQISPTLRAAIDAARAAKKGVQP